MVRTVPFRNGSTSSQVMMAVVILACFIACAGAQQQQGQKHEKKHDAKKQIEDLEEKWRTAYLAGDATTMDRMLSDDFIGISMSGQVHTKAQYLERIQSHKLALTKMDLSDMKVKILDSVAVVTGQADVEGTSEGISIKGIYRYTRVYREVPSGQWKVTSFEATRIRQTHEGKLRGSASASQSAVIEAASWLKSEGVNKGKALVSQGLSLVR